MVFNAVKVADFRFCADKDDYVLFLGRMNPDKGAHLAIDAARAAGRRIVLAGAFRRRTAVPSRSGGCRLAAPHTAAT